MSMSRPPCSYSSWRQRPHGISGCPWPSTQADRDEPAAAGAVQLADHAALRAQAQPVGGVLHVAAGHDPPVVDQRGRARPGTSNTARTRGSWPLAASSRRRIPVDGHLACPLRCEGIVFLHAVKEGPASRSYGLARAARGVPREVVAAAREYLAALEKGGARARGSTLAHNPRSRGRAALALTTGPTTARTPRCSPARSASVGAGGRTARRQRRRPLSAGGVRAGLQIAGPVRLTLISADRPRCPQPAGR